MCCFISLPVTELVYETHKVLHIYTQRLYTSELRKLQKLYFTDCCVSHLLFTASRMIIKKLTNAFDFCVTPSYKTVTTVYKGFSTYIWFFIKNTFWITLPDFLYLLSFSIFSVKHWNLKYIYTIKSHILGRVPQSKIDQN